MQRKYSLNKRRAKDQIKGQILSIKIFYYWFIYCAVNIGFVILKFATSSNISKYSNFYFVLAIVIYFLLYLAEVSSILRAFLILCQFQFSALYLSNCLKTLIDRIDQIDIFEMDQKNLNQFTNLILGSYNQILKNQRKLNHHCERNFLMYFLFASYTIVLPIVILFLDPKEKILIVSNIFSYCFMFINLFPPVLFNSWFTEAVSSRIQ